MPEIYSNQSNALLGVPKRSGRDVMTGWLQKVHRSKRSNSSLPGLYPGRRHARILLIPHRRYVIEDQPELMCLTRLQRLGRYRFYIDVGLAHTDQTERHRHHLGRLANVILERHRNVDPSDRLIALIAHLPIHVRDLAAGEVLRLTHLQIGDG